MIETKRLIIIPLTYGQLVKYTRCDHSLERELDLRESDRVIGPELREALELTILPVVADPGRNYLYSTLWTAISKADRRMVGDLCMMGEPNADGEVEIGYGTYPEFQGQGFMTEMVGGMIGWAKSEPRIRAVTAATEKSNEASYRVLLKNHFIRSGETETLFLWRLELNPGVASRPQAKELDRRV